MLKTKIYILGVVSVLFTYMGVISVNAQANGIETAMDNYVALTFDHFAAMAGGDTSFQTPLRNNTSVIADNITQTYDAEIGGGFETIWNQRLDLFDAYILAFQGNDPVSIESTKADITLSVSSVSAYLEEIVTNFSGGDAYAQLGSIDNLFYQAIEDYSAGNLAQFEVLEAESVRQIKVLSASLASRVAQDLILITAQQEAEAAAQLAAEQAAIAAAAQLAAEQAAQSEAALAAAALDEPVQAPASVLTTSVGTTAAPTVAATTATSTDTEESTTTTEVVSETTETTTVTENSNTITTDEASTNTFVFPFVDVNETHDYLAIANVKERAIVGGYPDGTYRPDISINRAEFTKIVVGAIDPNPFGSNCFPDVAQEWFAGPVCTALEENIIAGYPDGTFKPGNTVNMVEGYKIIAETLFPGEALPTTVWYQTYLNLAIDKGFYIADVAIDAEMTRGQMASIISRALTAQEG